MGVRRPTGKTVETSRTRAVKALFACFNASIEQQLKKKSKRPIRPGRMAAIRASQIDKIIASLSRTLHWIEEDYGKRYRDWTSTEHLEAARLIERIYSRTRAELTRGPGRPRRTLSNKGLIASHMYLPTKREVVKQRALKQKQIQAELFRHADQYKTHFFRNESKMVRGFLSHADLPPSYLGRLKKALSNRRVNAARRRR